MSTLFNHQTKRIDIDESIESERWSLVIPILYSNHKPCGVEVNMPEVFFLTTFYRAEDGLN